MKIKAEPATAHELDQKDYPILHSTKSATKKIAKATSSSTLSQQRQRTPYAFRNEGPTATFKYGTVNCSETIQEMFKIYQGYGLNAPMTIFTRSQDRSRERNEVPGCKFRKVFGTDDTEVLQPTQTFQRSQYVGLTAFITENDRNCTPRIYVEQSIIQNGHEKIMIHELTFGGQIQTDIEYIFRGIGDEHPLFGKRDLKVRLLYVNHESFESYMSGAGYYGYDRTEYITLNRDTLTSGVAYPVNTTSWRTQSYHKNITFDPADLRILLDAKQKREKDKKQGETSELELLRICMHNFVSAEDGRAVGDLNLRVVYTP